MEESRKESKAANPADHCCSVAQAPIEPNVGCSPLAAAFSLGEYIRCERGTAGVRQYIAAMNALLPYDLIEQLARKFDVSAPPKPPEPCVPPPVEKAPKTAGMSPEQLVMMMNAFSGGQKGALDPSVLMQLMKK